MIERFDSGASKYYQPNVHIDEITLCVGRPVLPGYNKGAPSPTAIISYKHGSSGVFEIKARKIQAYREPEDKYISRAVSAASKTFVEMRGKGAATAGDYKGTNERVCVGSGYVARGKKNQIIETPRCLYNELDSIFKFDFDPCPVFPTKDAMTISWGKTNFVNPPFVRTDAFVFKAIEEAKHRGNTTIILCPSTTHSRWFGIAAESGFLKWVVFLRHGLSFEGFEGSIPVRLMLLCVSPGQAKQIKGMFIDPLGASKRRIKSCEKKTGINRLIDLMI